MPKTININIRETPEKRDKLNRYNVQRSKKIEAYISQANTIERALELLYKTEGFEQE